MCKSRANLIFQVLLNYIWFLWSFALNISDSSKLNCTFNKWHIPHPAPLHYSPQVVKFESISQCLPSCLHICWVKAYSVDKVWFSQRRSLNPCVCTVHTDYWTREASNLEETMLVSCWLKLNNNNNNKCNFYSALTINTRWHCLQ